MNKNILTTITLLALTSGASNAQVSGFNVGYCQGEMGPFPTNEEFFSNGSVQKQVWTSAAILLPTDKVQSLKGNELREIRAALCSKLNVDSLAVWVSTSLDGPVLTADTIASPTKNWNTITLSQPLAITAETGALYIGMSYHQKSTSKALSVVETPMPGYSLFARYGDGEWTDFSQKYALSLEGLVYGDNLPKYDLTLEAITLPKDYVVDNGTFTFTARVRNNATCTITGFDAICSIEGIDETYSAHCDSTLVYGQVGEATFTIQPTGITGNDPRYRNITITIDNLNEGQDEVMSDNSQTGRFTVTLHSFVRQVLLEEFTTEKCSNCPRVASYVHDALHNDEFAGRLNTTEHHAGYYTDIYTIPADNDWCWFYDNQYAPAIMYDRHTAAGAITPISNPGSKQELYDQIRKRLREPAFVSMKIDAVVDAEAQKIHVTVKGSRAKEDFTAQPARITLVLTETNIVTTGQAGYAGEYTHLNVGRRVSNTWGEVLEWDGDDYTYEYTFGYTKDYKFENIGILAFIHDYDPSDKTKCDVANSAAITSSEFVTPDGITAVNADLTGASACFDLNGRSILTPAQGLSIEMHDGKAVKVWRK